MSLSQNDLGRAFEYGIVVAMSNIIPAEIIENAQLENMLEYKHFQIIGTFVGLC